MDRRPVLCLYGSQEDPLLAGVIQMDISDGLIGRLAKFPAHAFSSGWVFIAELGREFAPNSGLSNPSSCFLPCSVDLPGRISILCLQIWMGRDYFGSCWLRVQPEADSEEAVWPSSQR